MNRSLAVAVVFAARLAFAQAEVAQPPTDAQNPSTTTPPADSAPADAAATTAADAQPADTAKVAEDVGFLQQKLDGLTEQYGETKNDVLSLKRLKFSGYIQGRYVYADNSKQGVDARGRNLVIDGFTVRRGRFKAVYSLDWSEYLLQIDATPSGVVLKDAEVHLIEPWTGKRLELVMGQTKWPFGYEVLQSSSEREMPERSRVVRAFAPGERDRGAKLNMKLGVLRFSGGVFDGNGTQNTGFIGVDNDKNKDGVARLGFDLLWISGGVSGWYGKTFRPASFDATGLQLAPGKTFVRDRIGADVQLYLDLLPIGGTAVKGEFIAGHTWQKSGVEQYGVPAIGWYALVVQNLGDKDAIAARYDFFDGLAGTPDKVNATNPSVPDANNGVGTLGVTAIHYWNESVKISATYEVVMTGTPADSADPKDNQFTLQLQAKF